MTADELFRNMALKRYPKGAKADKNISRHQVNVVRHRAYLMGANDCTVIMHDFICWIDKQKWVRDEAGNWYIDDSIHISFPELFNKFLNESTYKK